MSFLLFFFISTSSADTLHCLRDKTEFGGQYHSVKVESLSRRESKITWASSNGQELSVNLPCGIVDRYFLNCEKPGSPIPSRKSILYSRLKTAEFVPMPGAEQTVAVQSIEFYLRIPNPEHQTSYLERRYEFPLSLCQSL